MANSGSALTAMLANTAFSVDWAVWGRWPSTPIVVLANGTVANDPVNADRGVGQRPLSTLIAVLANDPHDPVNAVA